MIGVLPRWQTVAILAVLAVIGLRDKVIFLAARGEVYGAAGAGASCSPGRTSIVGGQARVHGDLAGRGDLEAQPALPVRDLDDAGQQPVHPVRAAQAVSSSRTIPTTCGQAGWRGFIAHFSTAVEGLVPLVLFFSHGGWPTATAAFVMIVFHLNILLAFPMGVPLEWNVFMIFGVLCAVRRARSPSGLSDLANPLADRRPVRGHRRNRRASETCHPRKVSFLPGMRYYAGNWDTTVWCVKPAGGREDPHWARARSARCTT